MGWGGKGRGKGGEERGREGRVEVVSGKSKGKKGTKVAFWGGERIQIGKEQKGEGRKEMKGKARDRDREYIIYEEAPKVFFSFIQNEN